MPSPVYYCVCLCVCLFVVYYSHTKQPCYAVCMQILKCCSIPPQVNAGPKRKSAPCGAAQHRGCGQHRGRRVIFLPLPGRSRLHPCPRQGHPSELLRGFPFSASPSPPSESGRLPLRPERARVTWFPLPGGRGRGREVGGQRGVPHRVQPQPKA